MHAFKTYIVGGAVRDRLLGLPVQDRDWVVVGASPEQMLAAGFRPVGKDFPVFLHPKTQEEYALARTERKTAPGYKGFVFHADASVGLEEDLIRRDLTINAMAEDADGQLIDPFGGQRDLAARQFRHVSPAFLEDPVRILRLARFAARFADFQVAPETLSLMQEMVASGEIDHLVPERVWQEIARGLMYPKPSRMIEVLRECGALARLLPELDHLFGIPQPVEHHPEIDTGRHILHVIDYAATRNETLPVRWAALLHDLGKGNSPRENWPHHYGHEERGVPMVEAICARLKVPLECRDLAVLACREHGVVHKAGEMRPATLCHFFERIDALRRPQRLDGLLAVASCDFHGRPGYEARIHAAPALLRKAYQAFASIDAGALVRGIADKSQIPARLHEARSNAIRQAFGEETARTKNRFLLEFHDSEVLGVEVTGNDLLMRFSAAAVRGLNEPAGNSGYVRGVEIRFLAAQWRGPIRDAVGRLASANLSCSGAPVKPIRIPDELKGPAEAEFNFNNGTVLSILAGTIVLSISGEVRVVDSYAC